MRSKAPLLVGLAAVALAGPGGLRRYIRCVPASAPSSFALFDPCAVPSGDYPPGKLEAMQQICHQTLPPVEGTSIPWLDAPYTGPRPTPTATVDVEAAYPHCGPTGVDVTFAGWSTQDELGRRSAGSSRAPGAP